MTLRELKAKISKTPEEECPSVRAVRGSDSPIVAQCKTPRTEITVYQSGYGIFSAQGQETVLRVDTCRDYTFSFATGSEYYPEDYFLNQGFEVLLELIGSEKLWSYEKRKVTSHRADTEKEFAQSSNVRDIEDQIILKEWKSELFDSLPDKQKEIFVLSYEQGCTTREIGRMKGCSNASVHHIQKKIVKKAKKMWEGG